jgi:hypothetical protein
MNFLVAVQMWIAAYAGDAVKRVPHFSDELSRSRGLIPTKVHTPWPVQ